MGPVRAERDPRRRDEQPPLSHRPRRAGPGVRRELRRDRLRRLGLARRVGRGRSPAPPARGDAPGRADELAKAKAYIGGGLELRMEETRHLASWVGGQEALHDRVLTLDEALAAAAGCGRADV